MTNPLRLQPIAIGSLPHDNLEQAMKIVEDNFTKIPFFPQLANVNKNEDMMFQFLEGLPSFDENNPHKFIFDNEDEKFFENLEQFFIDYEEIITDINSPILEKYAISQKFSSTFSKFEQIIKDKKPQYAKGQIIGAFTLSTMLYDKNGNAAIFDETLRDLITKDLSLKALWQIKHIKSSCTNTTPIIFMDEPSISQIGTCAYLSIKEVDVTNMLKEISDTIKANGGISAVHCCGKCDWRIAINSGVDIVNFDAYSFADNFIAYGNEISKFLKNGGKIAWGLVPTLDSNILNQLSIEDLAQKFKNSVNKLTKYGIDEKLILDNSLITSSCGSGSMEVNDSELAMKMIKDLAHYLSNEGKNFDS